MENSLIKRLFYKGKEIILIGTSHVSPKSIKMVKETIETEKPDTVCVELCEARYQAITQKTKWAQMDIVKVIKSDQTLLLFAHLLLAAFQKKMAKKFDIKPGEEMITAINSAQENNAELVLADRNIQITLQRALKSLTLWEKGKILFQLIYALIKKNEDMDQDTIESIKEKDVMQTLINAMKESFPTIHKIILDDRDKYLSHNIKNAPGEKIVAAVGAAHMEGIEKYLNDEIDIAELNTLPEKTKIPWKWIVPGIILLVFASGFFFGGAKAGIDMIWLWISVNSICAGIGALAALAHPLSILTAAIAAPIASINPMIATGWIAGLTEAFIRKPKVSDAEALQNDILSLKGFYTNKITKIILIVILTNIGSSIGTFSALYFMSKLI